MHLHEAFKVPLRRLLKQWFEAKTKRNKMPEDFEWLNFSESCYCSKKEQRIKNAAYYARRGLFHHTRGNALLAHKYLREANEQHPNNGSIEENYVETLRAVRNFDYDPILEDLLGSAGQLTRQSTGLSCAFHGKDEERKCFRNEYVWAIGKLRKIGTERTEQLARLLEGGRK